MLSTTSRRFQILPAFALALALLLAVLTTVAGVFGGVASANGSVKLVVIDEVAGPYLLRVGVLPGDPTIGPLHVSVLIQDASGDAAVDDATVRVSISGPGAPGGTEAVNSPQSPQLYEGNLTLDSLGDWAVTLDIDGPRGPATHTFNVRARDVGGFNLMYVIVAVAVVLVVGSLAWSQLQRRRRLSRGR